MDRIAHWERVYQTKRPEEVSWFQVDAALSRELILRVAPDPATRILDVGAGASRLVDGLLTNGYTHVTLLDIAPAALATTGVRLGATSAVRTIPGDVLSLEFPAAAYDLWHDRAVFHFLTDPADRGRYLAQLRRALRPGGLVIIATFAEDGPTRCSGLEVTRYSAESLHATLGAGFSLIDGQRELHTTPSGAQQAFTYAVFRLDPDVT